MDFSVIFQLRTKKFWWMDVIFYFVMSLLIATILCWIIFLVKNNFQREDIKKEAAALLTVGTSSQQAQEKEVINYRKKINDFATLLKNHEFASNVFAFMETQTMPDVWFKQFSLDEKNNEVQLSGESDSIDAFSRQVAAFEKNQYVKSLGNLNSSLGQFARVEFSMNLTLDQSIFSYLTTPLISTTTPSGQASSQAGQTASSASSSSSSSSSSSATSSVASGQQVGSILSSEKLITSFHLLLNPEVIGTLDETKYTVTLKVPYGTDVKNLTSSIVISPGATVLPSSNVPQDFTNPVIYRVTAQDGSAQNYTVNVIVGARSGESNNSSGKPSQSGFGILVITILVVIIIAVILVISFLAWKKMQGQKAKF